MGLMEYSKAIDGQTPIPREIINFYVQHEYGEKNIPLNVDTCKKIAELLVIQEIEEMRRQ